MFVGIDRLKEVNDTHGHEFGDLLLRAVALRLAKSAGKSDTVARIGGDEFVIILDEVREIGDANAVASKVERDVAAPYLLRRSRLNVTVSIGISFYPENGEDANTLLGAAGYAMYLAKRKGGNSHLTCLPGVPHPGEDPERD
jgi:diguanylate cyclase (GGDEF)-like protein